MAPEKITALTWSPELIEQFAPAAERNPWGALERPGEILSGSFCFEIVAGRQRALMAVRPYAAGDGMRAEITGLVSSGPLFHFQALDRAAVLIAHQLDADVLAMSTQVPNLVRGCNRVGWVTSGAILTKWMGKH